MKTTFHVDFRDSQDGSSLGYAQLESDLAFAPSKDIAFAHPVGHGSRLPRTIEYNTEDKTFFVTFDHDPITAAHLQQQAQMYKGHGWTLSTSLVA